MKFPEIPKYRTFCFPIVIPDKPEEGILFEYPDVCRCLLRKTGNDPALKEFEHLQNYIVSGPDSENLVLEGVIELESKNHPDWKQLRIGIPLSEIPHGSKLFLQYTGTEFQLIADGKILDAEYPFGEPVGKIPENYSKVRMIPSESHIRKQPMHLWCPEGLNTWVGDVSLGFFNGILHLFYLFDRRHHCSKFGKGGHCWGHISTKDFHTWQDDGIVLPLEQQWQSFGTGTPFIHQGKVALAYGIHSERFEEIPGTVPAGATIAVSDENGHFIPERITYDDLSANPSTYHDADGSLFMYHGYGKGNLKLYRAEKWPDFKLVNDHILPSGQDAFMRNNLDCPAYFNWHGKCFMLLGFSAMWMASDLEFSDKFDLGEAGLDLYDGLEVPMVADIGNNRRILAGWLPAYHSWGGMLGIRELCWMEDGIPGIRWMEEVMPEREEPQTMEGNAEFPGNGYFEFDLEPQGDLVIRFGGTGEGVEFRLNGKLAKAALTPLSIPGFPLYRENPARRIQERFIFAVDHLRKLDSPFKVRIMVRTERKWGGSVVDVEIAGCRTLIHHFPGSYLTNFRILAGKKVFSYSRINV